ncbi:MAG: hypothetical protein HUK22_05650, partial [Thermoguttaceae bacterium]|nr:hypothetical protein [Thermoguttaceae bacterium]
MKLFDSFSTSRARRASRFFALFVALGCFVGCQSTGPKSLTSDDCPGCDAESQDVQRAQTPEAPAAPSSLNSTSTGSSSAPTNTGAQIDFFDSGNVAGNYDEPAYYGGGSSNGAALRSSYSSDAYISEANKTTTASVSAAAVDPSSRLESNSLPEAPQTSSLQSASQSFQNSATKLQEKTQEALTSAQNGLQNAVDAAGNAANELQTKAQDALNSARDGLQNAA